MKHLLVGLIVLGGLWFGAGSAQAITSLTSPTATGQHLVTPNNIGPSTQQMPDLGIGQSTGSYSKKFSPNELATVQDLYPYPQGGTTDYGTYQNVHSKPKR
jgi:hypothetical protein